MVKLKPITRLVSLLFLSAALSGIATSPASAGACDVAAEQAKITVIGDWLPWSVQGPIFAAQQNGYYKEEGLEVDLVAPANVADQLKMVSAGRAEFSLVEASMIMAAREENIPIHSVAVMLRPLPLGLGVLGDSSITSPADLKGKIIGVNALPSALAMTRSALASAGLSESDVKFIDPGFGAIELLVTGKIDAAYMLENAEPIIAKDILAKEGKPPLRFLHFRDNGVPDFYYIVMAANENWTRQNPGSACRFLRATARGYRSFASNPGPVNKEMAAKNEIFTLEQHGKITEANADQWTDRNGKVFRQEAAVWKAAQAWAMKNKLVTKNEDVSNYFTNDYLAD